MTEVDSCRQINNRRKALWLLNILKHLMKKNSSWIAFKVKIVIQTSGHAFPGTSKGLYRTENESCKRWGAAAPGAPGAVLLALPGLGCEGRGPWVSPAACPAILLPPHTGSVQTLHIYISCLRVPRKVRKESKLEGTKRDPAPVLPRLQDISVSMQKNSFWWIHSFWCICCKGNISDVEFRFSM